VPPGEVTTVLKAAELLVLSTMTSATDTMVAPLAIVTEKMPVSVKRKTGLWTALPHVSSTINES
jgi:hypothetical protein